MELISGNERSILNQSVVKLTELVICEKTICKCGRYHVGFTVHLPAGKENVCQYCVADLGKAIIDALL